MIHFKTDSLKMLIVMLLLGLSACGGSSSAPQAMAAFSPTACSGTAKELFIAIQGSYFGLVDPLYSTGTILQLTKGKSYEVVVSGVDCSIIIAGDNNAHHTFAYSDSGHSSKSTITGFSLTEVIKEPTTLDLEKTQYIISIVTDRISLELERRVSANSTEPGISNGDLYLSTYGPDGVASVYAIAMNVASKH